MARLPETFAGAKIRARFPYNMPGELVIGFSRSGVVFQDVLFSNQVEKPFEIHRIVPRVAALDSDQSLVLPQPDQDLLQSLVRLDITDLRTDQKLNKAPTLIRDLVNSLQRTWEWEDPYTMPNGGGFQVAVTTLANPGLVEVTQLKLELIFQGFLLQIVPPSDAR